VTEDMVGIAPMRGGAEAVTRTGVGVALLAVVMATELMAIAPKDLLATEWPSMACTQIATGGALIRSLVCMLAMGVNISLVPATHLLAACADVLCGSAAGC
jgi:hypothetical protein